MTLGFYVVTINIFIKALQILGEAVHLVFVFMESPKILTGQTLTSKFRGTQISSIRRGVHNNNVQIKFLVP